MKKVIFENELAKVIYVDDDYDYNFKVFNKTDKELLMHFDDVYYPLITIRAGYKYPDGRIVTWCEEILDTRLQGEQIEGKGFWFEVKTDKSENLKRQLVQNIYDTLFNNKQFEQFNCNKAENSSVKISHL